jgi:dCTP diphosphatase
VTDETIEGLTQLLREFVAERSLQQWHTPRNLALALAGEVGELCQLLRWIPEGDVSDLDSEALRGELADIAIFLFHLADALELDLAAIIRWKIGRNEARF